LQPVLPSRKQAAPAALAVRPQLRDRRRAE
jgi:hypothetical protein